MSRQDEGERLRAQIDENLKRAFNETVQQDIPDRLKNLLAQLRKQESEK